MKKEKFIYIITGNINDFHEQHESKRFLNFLDLVDSLKPDENGKLSLYLKELDENKDYIINVGSSKRMFSSYESEIGMTILLFKEMGLIDNIYVINPPIKMRESIIKTANGFYEEIYYPFKSYTSEKLVETYNSINDKIIGQSKAMKKIFSNLIAHDNTNKTKVILLYGPSGVGKTESIKTMTESLFGKNTLTRIQMSMLNDYEGTNYLFGNDKNNKTFSEDLLSRKSNFILFDEFDKCPVTLYNAFYQLFDESRYKDNHFDVCLKGTIIFCTTNFNSLEEIKDKLGKPIFSRIDMCIEYEEIKLEEKRNYLKNTFHEKWGCFEYKDEIKINEEVLLDILMSEPLHSLNMREISKMIESSINRVYFNELIKKS